MFLEHLWYAWEGSPPPPRASGMLHRVCLAASGLASKTKANCLGGRGTAVLLPLGSSTQQVTCWSRVDALHHWCLLMETAHGLELQWRTQFFWGPVSAEVHLLHTVTSQPSLWAMSCLECWEWFMPSLWLQIHLFFPLTLKPWKKALKPPCAFIMFISLCCLWGILLQVKKNLILTPSGTQKIKF